MSRTKAAADYLKWFMVNRLLPWWPLVAVIGGVCAAYFAVVGLSSSPDTVDAASVGNSEVEGGSKLESTDTAGDEEAFVPVPLADRIGAYEKAERLAERGSVDEARAQMRRLAPLTGALIDGLAEAHVWMAKDQFTGLTNASLDEGEDAVKRPARTGKAVQEIGQHLTRATELAQDDEEAFELLAMLHRLTGQRQAAVALLEDAVTRMPDLRLLLAQLLVETGDKVSASEHAKQAALSYRELALSDSGDPTHRLRWARAEMLQENDEAALAIIERGETLHRDEARYHEQRLALHLRQCQRHLAGPEPNFEKAWAAVETLLEISQDRPAVIGQIGLLSSIPTEKARAKRLLLQQAESETTPGVTYKILGELEAGTGQWAKAISWFEKALEREPEAIVAKNNLAWSLIQVSSPKLDRALLLIDEAIAGHKQLYPGRLNPSYLETRGQILVKMGKYKEGVSHLEQALRFMPEASKKGVHAALAVAYEEMGNRSMADTHKRLSKGEGRRG